MSIINTIEKLTKLWLTPKFVVWPHGNQIDIEHRTKPDRIALLAATIKLTSTRIEVFNCCTYANIIIDLCEDSSLEQLETAIKSIL